MGSFYKSKYLLVFVAVFSLLFAIFISISGSIKSKVPEIPFPPPVSPYKHFVAATGIVEGASLNMNLGSSYNELVTEIYAVPGMKIKKGDLLFKVDDRSLKAQLKEAKANKEILFERYIKLINVPREENLIIAQKEMEKYKIMMEGKEKEFSLYENIKNKGTAVSDLEFIQKEYSFNISKGSFYESLAKFNLVKAGTWEKDLNIAFAEIVAAEKNIGRVRANLDKSFIKSPIDGEVLKVNVRIGQMANLIFPNVLIGDTSSYLLRVSVDEEDVWRIKEHAKGVYFVRGNSSLSGEMEFVRIEPNIIPKKIFTGDIIERVDTRVLEIIYKIQKNDLFNIYVGELLDVFLESLPSKENLPKDER